VRAEPARFDLAYRLLDACDQIVANSFLLRQRVVNASELVAHLHENVPRVVRAICVAVEVQLGPKIGYEVNKQLSSLCACSVPERSTASTALMKLWTLSIGLPLFAHLSAIMPRENHPPSNKATSFTSRLACRTALRTSSSVRMATFVRS
jgi:hypothetical protein